jgi:hypothetical protein
VPAARRWLPELLARLSALPPLVLTVVARLTVRMAQQPEGAATIALIYLGLAGCGCLFAIAALLFIPRYGPAGILWPAVGGLAFNLAMGALVLL